MKFLTRDLLWLTAVTALSLVWFNSARRNASNAQIMDHRVQQAEAEASRIDQKLQGERKLSAKSAERGKQERQARDEEIRRLRELLRSSIGDQRNWFALEVSGKRLIAIRPATAKSPRATPCLVTR